MKLANPIGLKLKDNINRLTIEPASKQTNSCF